VVEREGVAAVDTWGNPMEAEEREVEGRDHSYM
jgi:hypothetical protein